MILLEEHDIPLLLGHPAGHVQDPQTCALSRRIASEYDGQSAKVVPFGNAMSRSIERSHTMREYRRDHAQVAAKVIRIGADNLGVPAMVRFTPGS
jgi:hypothetical protein